MSEFACPECHAPAPRGARAGHPYACPACGNPVLPTQRAGVDEVPHAADAIAAVRPRWKLALLAFIVLGAAYLGAYELLTAEAKRDRDRLFAKHGTAISTFERPGQVPVGTDAASLRDYREQKAKFDDRMAYEARASRIDMMFIGLMCAFGAQTIVTGLLLVKTGARARAATRRATPKRSRQPSS